MTRHDDIKATVAPGDRLSRLATQAPRSDRFIEFSGLGAAGQLSHCAVLDAAGEMAARLAARGLQRGDQVGICLPNGLDWVILDLACLRLGLIVAGFDPAKFTPDADLKARYGLALLVVPESRPMCTTVAELTADPLREEESPSWVSHGIDDEVALKFTSGSTGEPKALAATWGSIGMSLTAVEEMFHHGPKDRLFVFLTLSLLQQRYWVYTALLQGCNLTVACARSALSALAEARPTAIMGVPSFFESLKTYIETQMEVRNGQLADCVEEITGGALRYMWTGSAPIRLALLEWFEEQAGLPLFEGYGMNETCIATKNHPSAHKRGSVGRPVLGKHVWMGDDGVVRVRSEFPVNTRYAFAAPGASDRVFDGDTVWTGDLGRIDADGFLWITGRVDDVIVLENGRNIITREIEERAVAVSGVRHCVLAGSGRPWLVALIDGTADTEAVRAALNSGTESTRDARVRAVVAMAQVPTEANGMLTSQGKLVRSAILSAHADLINDVYAKELHHV